MYSLLILVMKLLMKLSIFTLYKEISNRESNTHYKYIDEISTKVPSYFEVLLFLVIGCPIVTSSLVCHFISEISNYFWGIFVILSSIALLPFLQALYLQRKYNYAGIVYDLNKENFVFYTAGKKNPSLHTLEDIRHIKATITSTETTILLKLYISNPTKFEKLLDNPYKKVKLCITTDDYNYLKSRLQLNYPDRYTFS